MKEQWSDVEQADHTPLLGKRHASAENHGEDGQQHRTSNIFYAVFNLTNDVYSVNAVAFPLYFALSGFGWSCFLLVIFSIVSAYTCYLLFILEQKYRISSYPALCEEAFGKPGALIISWSMFIYNFGGLLAGLIIVGQVLPDVIQYFINVTDPQQLPALLCRSFVLMYCTVVMLPFAFLRNISDLGILSTTTVMCVIGIMFLLLFRMAVKYPGSYISNTTSGYTFIHYTWIQSLGGLSYAFVCQDMSMAVSASLENPTHKRFFLVVLLAMILSFVASFLTGLGGYGLFFETCKDNIVENFDVKNGDWVGIVARLLLALGVVASTPYCCLIPRLAIVSLITTFFPNSFGSGNDTNYGHHHDVQRDEPKSMKLLHAGVTMCIMLVALVIVEFVTDLGAIFEFVGGVAANILGFIMPCLVYIRLMTRDANTPKVVTQDEPEEDELVQEQEEFASYKQKEQSGQWHAALFENRTAMLWINGSIALIGFAILIISSVGTFSHL